MSHIDYVNALEQQLNWHKWSLSPAAERLWEELRRTPNMLGHLPNTGAERFSFEVPIRRGEMFYVGKEFCNLLSGAVEDLPDCYLQEEWLPAEIGFVWFDRPMQLPAIDTDSKCDFCSTPAAWMFPCSEFIFKSEIVQRRGKDSPAFGSDGRWAACDTCASFIDTDRWDELLDRAVGTFFELHPVPSSLLSPDEFRAEVQRLHAEFRRLRSGPKVANDRMHLSMQALGWRTTMLDQKNVVQFGVYQGKRTGFFPLSHFGWAFGQSLAVRINEYEEMIEQGQGRYVERTRHEMRYAAALLLLMNQRILVRHTIPVERHQRKRFQREVNRVINEMKVVVLRANASAPARENGVSHHVDWQWRWIVRGHWRKQWYPSQQINQPVWIEPYVKGPEDLPVKRPTKSLFAVVR